MWQMYCADNVPQLSLWSYDVVVIVIVVCFLTDLISKLYFF